MKAITTEAEFRGLISQPALTSIFLDDGLSPDIASEVLSTWRGFNKLSEHRWNLIFPIFPDDDSDRDRVHTGAYTINDHLNSDRYDIELAKNISMQLNLPQRKFPAIVFIGHDKSDYFILSLRSRSGSNWRNHFRNISIICNDLEEELRKTNSLEFYKIDAARRVRHYLALHANFKKMGPALGFFANLLGIPSSAVSIIE